MIKWLIALAKTSPLVFSIALLLITIGAMTKVIINREDKLDRCENNSVVIQGYYMAKLDSLNAYHNSTIQNLTNKIEANLTATIDDYRDRLKTQKVINKLVDSTINKNKKILNKNKNTIQNLNNEEN